MEFVPPQEGKLTNTDLTAATPTSALATGAGGPGFEFSVAVSVAFNIVFSADGTNTVTNPVDNAVFPAGVYSFQLNAQNAYFKVTPSANGKMTHWHSSRA